MKLEDLNRKNRCAGCGSKLGEKELTMGKYVVSKAMGGELLRLRKDIRMKHCGLWYCGKCSAELDAFSLTCSCCGKKTNKAGKEMVKVNGAMYCLNCLNRCILGEPAEILGQEIHIRSEAYALWREQNPSQQYSAKAIIPLQQKTPVLQLWEDGTHKHDYVLETLPEEDFTGKWFHIEVRLNALKLQRGDEVPVAQIDGFVADTQEQRPMRSGDIGYRMEGYVMDAGGIAAQLVRNQMRGNDLVAKGLRYPGYITPGNVRLVGVCTACGRSITFKGYNFPMMQADPCYSDDGTDVLELYDPNIDKENWSITKNGKTFRYYNSFACRHCGEPYIDYGRLKQNKRFGVLGCCYLDRSPYRE